MGEWGLVSIFFPVFLPVLVLLVLFMFDLGATAHSKANPLIAVKDGQLSWAGLGMCINAMYELRHPAEAVALPGGWADVTFWELFSCVLALTLIAALGPVFQTKVSRPSGFWPTIWHFRVLASSVILTGAGAYLYYNVHLTTQAPHA